MRFAFSKVIAILIGTFLVACTANTPAEKKENIPERHGARILDTDTDKADSIFVYSNIVESEPYLTDAGKLYWYFQDNVVLWGDVQSEIKKCDDDRFLICVSSPFPFFLPKKLPEIDASYEINGSVYSIDLDDRLKGLDICNVVSIDFTIINDKFETFQYVVTRESGLLYFSITSPDGLKDGKLYRSSGAAFSFKPLCD